MTITQTKLNEDAIEKLAIERLEAEGFVYSHGRDIAPDSKTPLRDGFQDVVLQPLLKEAIDRINPNIPTPAREDALRQVLRIASPDLMTANKTFHRMLTEGVKVSYQKNGVERGDLVWLVDFNTISNNNFRVVNQFTITENHQNKRPDVILFINGLPLVVIELKNATNEHATLLSAWKQIQTYKQTIPSLFTYNSFVIISDGLEARAGSISSGMTRFMAWKTADGKTTASNLVSEMETLIKGMLNKDTLLDLIRHFIVFEKSSSIDSKTHITTVKTIKKLAAYHQYYAVNKAVTSVQTAAHENGNRKGGVVWHTQGSGKSLSMVFTAGKLVLALDNPTILVITDRVDLDKQIYKTF